MATSIDEATTTTTVSPSTPTPTYPIKAVKNKKYSFNSLPNPGKFDLNHSDAQPIVAPYYFAGARFTAASTIFEQPRTTFPDKQLIFIPSVEANHEGSGGNLVVRSMLGQRHSFEGSFDTSYNSSGRYKYSNGSFSLKPAFQFHSGHEMFSVEMDYKGPSYTVQAQALSHGELSLSYNQSLTPRWTAGVQLFTMPPFLTLFNWTTKVKGKRNDVIALSYKQGSLISSYTRKVMEQQIGPNQFIHSSLATELRIGLDPRKPFGNIRGSEWACGVNHTRPMSKYTATVASDMSVGVQAESYILPTMAVLFSGEMKYDGSNAGKFGVGFQFG